MALSKITNSGINNITVDSSGNVGIGTSSPTASLTVGAASNEGTLRIGDNGTYYGEIKRINASDELRIGHYGASQKLTFHTVNAERMRINSSGKLLINRTTGLSNGYLAINGGAAEAMSIQGGANNYIVSWHNTSGTLIGSITGSTGSSTSYNTTSDYRLKTAVNYDWDATSRLKQLKPARFAWISDGDDAVPVDGFLAHEVQDIVPEAISGTKDAVDDEGNPEYQGIDQSKLVPLLVKTIQELEARITALETA